MNYSYVTKRSQLIGALKEKYGARWFSVSDAIEIYRSISPNINRDSATAVVHNILQIEAERGGARGTD